MQSIHPNAVEILTLAVAHYFNLTQLYSVKEEIRKWLERNSYGRSFSEFYLLELLSACSKSDRASDEPLVMISGDGQLANEFFHRLHAALIKYFQTDSISDLDSILTYNSDSFLQNFIDQANLTLRLALEQIEEKEIEGALKQLPPSSRLTVELGLIVIEATLEDCDDTDQVIAMIRATFESEPDSELTLDGAPTDANNMDDQLIACCLNDAFVNWRNMLHDPFGSQSSLSAEFNIGALLMISVKEELLNRKSALIAEFIPPNANRDWGLIGIRSSLDQPYHIYAVGFNGNVNSINSMNVGTSAVIDSDAWPNPFHSNSDFYVLDISDGNFPSTVQSIADTILHDE